MSNPIDHMLTSRNVVLLDGGLATELEKRGCDLNHALWSAKVLAEAPDLIRAVHLEYFEAGAECATTASYQATYTGFARLGYSQAETDRLLHLSVELACQARDHYCLSHPQTMHPIVAASVGPYGAYLADGSEYHGNYHLPEAELIAFHKRRLAVLISAGADMIAFETLPALNEAKVLLRLLEDFPGISAWFSFTAKDGCHISHGETFAECVDALQQHPQVAAIGINCTSPQYIPDLMTSVSQTAQKPIMAYPNCGETYLAHDNSWHGERICHDFGRQAAGWYKAGARVVGGCCRTTPDHIREIAAQFRQMEPVNA
jgi:homocysteine S-methyltransferase